jgi:3-oxoacyl-[acyl-carrier-protein] synthase III
MGTVKQKQAKKAGSKMTQELREDLQNAKRYLQKGELKEVAAEVGVHKQAVTDVLNGRSVNWNIIEKIIERAEKNKNLVVRAQAL